MRYCTSLKKISLPKLEYMADDFLGSNRDLEELFIPKVKKIGGKHAIAQYT